MTTASAAGSGWLATNDAAHRVGVTTRTLYRFIDEGQLVAYRMGRVIRLKTDDVDAFIESLKVTPGTLSHLYPEANPRVHQPGADFT